MLRGLSASRLARRGFYPCGQRFAGLTFVRLPCIVQRLPCAAIASTSYVEPPPHSCYAAFALPTVREFERVGDRELDAQKGTV